MKIRALALLVVLCTLAGSVDAKKRSKKRDKNGKDSKVSAADLAKAVAKGNLKKTKELIAAGASPDYQNFGKGEGYTPVMVAAREGHGKVLAALLALGPKEINLERVDKEGWNALMHAVDKRRFDTATALIKFAKKRLPPASYTGEILNRVSKAGLTPLLILATSLDGSKDARKLFTTMAKDGAGVGGFDTRVQFHPQGLISKVAEKGEAALLRLILKLGANVNEGDETGVTPLMTACVMGNDDAADVLLSAGANVTVADAYGKTALHQAAVACSVKTIEAIVAKGANLAAKDIDGATALNFAERARQPGQERVLELLRGTSGKEEKEEL